MNWKVGQFDLTLRHPALLWLLASGALVLLSLPILQTPPPGLELAYWLLFGAWAVVILALFVLSRCPDRPGSNRTPGDRGSSDA